VSRTQRFGALAAIILALFVALIGVNLTFKLTDSGVNLTVGTFLALSLVLGWMLFGYGYPKMTRYYGPAGIAAVVLGLLWAVSGPVTPSDTVAQRPTSPIGYYTDHVVVDSSCHVFDPGHTGMKVTAYTDGNTCYADVESVYNDLDGYATAADPVTIRGDYAPNGQWFAYNAPMGARIDVFGYNQDVAYLAQLLPDWTSHVQGMTAQNTHDLVRAS